MTIIVLSNSGKTIQADLLQIVFRFHVYFIYPGDCRDFFCLKFEILGLVLGLNPNYIVVFPRLFLAICFMDVLKSLMNKILLLILISLSPLTAYAEFSLDDFNLKQIYDLEGWTPRYAYVVDDNYIGRTHYAGISFFKRQGAAHEGPTFRVGFGQHGEKINLSYTSGFSFMGVDMGVSYLVLNQDNDRRGDASLAGFSEGLGLELGLRIWVVQIIALQLEESSYVSLAYGF